MGFITLKALEVDGKELPIGSPVPGAEAWPNLNAWVRRGHIAFCVDGQEGEFLQRLREGKSGYHLASNTRERHVNQAARALQSGAPAADDSASSASPPKGGEIPAGAPPSESRHVPAAAPQAAHARRKG